MTRRPPVVILIELLPRERYGSPKIRFFPFLCGYLTQLGLSCTWIIVSYAARRATQDPLCVDLVPQARDWLEGQARQLRATHMICSESLVPTLAEDLGAVVPNLLWFDAPGPLDAGRVAWLHHWLGLAERAEGYLPDLCSPRYECTPCPVPSPPKPPLIPIVAEPSCVYTASVAVNPCYRGVPLEGVPNQRGCAFCNVPVGPAKNSTKPALESVAEQMSRASCTPCWVRNRSGFQLDSSLVMQGLDRLLARMAQDDISPTQLHVTIRADELIRREESIARGLEMAAAAGHTVHLWSIGAENFSEQENLRLNKGLGRDTVVEAISRARAWEERFPATFFFERAGGMGFILFSPWTTLDDLAINVRVARELRLEHPRFFLTRRLMLLPDLPITVLARHEGLTDDLSQEDEQVFALLQRSGDPGCRHWVSQREIPWRFREHRTRAVASVLLRLATPEGGGGDPLQTRLAAALDTDSDLWGHAERLIALAVDPRCPDVDSLVDAWLTAVGSVEPSVRRALESHDCAAPEGVRLLSAAREADTGLVRMTFVGNGARVEILAGPAASRRWPIRRGAVGFGFGTATSDPSAWRSLLGWVAAALAPRRESLR